MNKTAICKMTLLYITLNLDNIDTIGKHLYTKYQQHRVLFAADGTDALMHLLDNKPDIFIVDTNIQPINFSVVMTELSKRNKINQTIFIDSKNNKALLNYDFRYFLPTPIDTNILCMMIDTIALEIFSDRIASFYD